MYDPDLIALVQDEAHRRFGALLSDDTAVAALQRIHSGGSPVRPELEAAATALRRWRTNHAQTTR